MKNALHFISVIFTKQPKEVMNSRDRGICMLYNFLSVFIDGYRCNKSCFHEKIFFIYILKRSLN